MGRISSLVKEPFWTKKKVTNRGCWRYVGSLTHNGYGQITNKSSRWRLHRYVWFIINGPIPKNHQVLHKCDVRNCFRPSHLFLGTAKDNIWDMIHKNRHGFFWRKI